MTVRTTEQIATEDIADDLKAVRFIFAAFGKLTTDQPTTAELEEALAALPGMMKSVEKAMSSMDRVLRIWISSRHLIAANAHRAQEYRLARLTRMQTALRAVTDSEWIATAEEEEAFDEMESRTAHLCPVFAPQVAL